MIYLLLLFIGIVCGGIIGFMFAAVLTAGSNSDDSQEAYNRGFEAGKNSTLEDVNNLYNKYKDMANGYNND